jgi:hypothetical protein
MRRDGRHGTDLRDKPGSPVAPGARGQSLGREVGARSILWNGYPWHRISTWGGGEGGGGEGPIIKVRKGVISIPNVGVTEASGPR